MMSTSAALKRAYALLHDVPPRAVAVRYDLSADGAVHHAAAKAGVAEEVAGSGPSREFALKAAYERVFAGLYRRFGRTLRLVLDQARVAPPTAAPAPVPAVAPRPATRDAILAVADRLYVMPAASKGYYCGACGDGTWTVAVYPRGATTQSANAPTAAAARAKLLVALHRRLADRARADRAFLKRWGVAAATRPARR